MDFIQEVLRFSSRIQAIVGRIATEEATKHSLILPFIQLLGYNVFDPAEVVPEFTADVGTKKGEKVDYAIMINGRPEILIEAKSVGDNLTTHGSQLFRYFTATEARFAILTNGLVYRFYSDLQEPNKMDAEPFLEFDLADPKEVLVAEIKRFHKESFNAEDLTSVASNLKYSARIKSFMDAQFKEPSEAFMRFLLKEAYNGVVTRNVLERFRPIVKKALNNYIGELLSEKIKSALAQTESKETEVAAAAEPSVIPIPGDDGPRVETTDEELEGFYVIKALLRDAVDPSRIQHKDTASYFNVLLDGNVRRWICRLRFGASHKYVCFPVEPKGEERLAIASVDDLFAYQERLRAIARGLTEQAKS